MSHILKDELSRTILELQRERYFEALTNKYWNHSAKGQCENTDDSEGITLESLGGVFIATLFGLALAMVTLVGEVIYYRRKDRRQTDVVMMVKPNENSSDGVTRKFRLPPSGKDSDGNRITNQITFGSEFIPASEQQNNLAFISSYPRRSIHDPNKID